MTNTTDKAMREALQSAFSALDRTDSEPGSDAFEREKEAMDEIRGVLASVPSTGAETKRPHDTEDAELTRDHGPYPEDAPLCQRLMWWIPRSAKHGKTGLESDLVEAAEALALASSAAAPEQAGRAQRMRDAGYTRRPTLREMADEAQPAPAAEAEPATWSKEREALIREAHDNKLRARAFEADAMAYRQLTKAQPAPDAADIIAGALQTSRAHAYELMRDALKDTAQPAPAAEATMSDAIAAGDGTLHGAVDYWQARALAAEAKVPSEAEQDAHATNQVLANNYLHLTCAPPAAPLSEPTAEGVAAEAASVLAALSSDFPREEINLQAVERLARAALSSPAAEGNGE